MTFGALVVLAVLVATALYIPKIGRTSAASEVTSSAPIETPPPNASQAEVQEPVPPAAEASQPAEESAVSATETKPIEQNQVAEIHPPATPAKKMASQLAGGNVPQAPQQQAAQANNAALNAELDAVEHDIDQLTGRADGVNSSLENLQRQQASMGLSLRGDMAGRQASMKNNLAKAQDAIQHNDLERAKRYAKLAEGDIEALEKFLGR
jgi:hypothetical protein